jgi:TonB family protein
MRLTTLFSMSFSTVCDRAARTLCLTGLFLCSCASVSSHVAFEGNPMPATQVASYLEVLTPSAAYDTPPKFSDGYAPFYPENEAKKNRLGYALLEFNVLTDGTTRDIRGIRATSYAFVNEAISAVREWRFEPARKNGNPVAVRVRLPFSFRS